MKKQRSSNIELLRIICMFMIVIHHFMAHGHRPCAPTIAEKQGRNGSHFMAHGGLWMLPTGINKIIVNFFMPFGKMAFVVFVVISCWFLTNSEFKGARFIKTWL